MKLRLKKGLDIRLEGAVADRSAVADADVRLYAVTPDYFPGFRPKAAVKEGDAVEAGSPLLYDKAFPAVKLVSPVSGTVKEVKRGERRKILYVSVEADGRGAHRHFDTKAPLPGLLAESGLLAMIHRRPYDVVPSPEVRPRDIFVTAMDTAPLALPPTLQPGACDPASLAAAVKTLSTLTDGKIYVCYGADAPVAAIPGAEMVEVSGPHPAGNVGVQIANLAPVNKGDTVWAMDLAVLARIGHLLLTGELDTSVVVAVAGPEVERPGLVRTLAGAAVAPLIAGRLKPGSEHRRVISGNVLTGEAVDPADGFLHAPYRQVTVIAEGDDVDEFMGWASVSPSKLSVSRALPLHGLRRAFAPDARLMGGRRAMILSGLYDKVLPMDVLPEYLLKAIISRDIDSMEALGIYEVAPEDMALCEFVDPSKLPVQQIVRDGLDYLRNELES